MLIVAAICRPLIPVCCAFVVFPEGRSPDPVTALCVHKKSGAKVSRRSFLALMPGVIGGVAAFSSAPKSVSARDELFKPNPLTNAFLEQVRIWEQAEADDLKYGGELAPGEKSTEIDSYPKLLVPILEISADLDTIDRLVHGGRDDRSKALKILEQPRFDKIVFKKIFNAYGDNIYYGDPDRANLYLGGGATPKTEQSLAYLLRNEILTNTEDLRAELTYVLEEDDNDTEELYRLSKSTISAMSQYLENVSPTEINRARELVKPEV